MNILTNELLVQRITYPEHLVEIVQYYIWIHRHQWYLYLTTNIDFPQPLTLPTGRLSVEYREKSVLGGISAVGGFWTALNGLFATIFGTTLLFVLFGE